MFARKEKPLPVAVLKPDATNDTRSLSGEGIHLGEGYYWNPEALPNGHIVAIGASGSGKTQTPQSDRFFSPSDLPPDAGYSAGLSRRPRDCRRDLLSDPHGISSRY